MNPESKDSYGIKCKKNRWALGKTNPSLNINPDAGCLFNSSLFPLVIAVLSNSVSLSSISSPVSGDHW